MFQDSVFMMPHLGVLSTVYREAAWNVFDKDCLVRLGTNVAPAGTGALGEPVMKVEMEMEDGSTMEEDLNFGDVKLIPLAERHEAKAVITPTRNFDMGEGPGRAIEKTIMGGVAGVLLDARGRPIYLPEEDNDRKELLIKWFRDLGLYPEEKLGALL
jgi:hypothetical protein